MDVLIISLIVIAIASVYLAFKYAVGWLLEALFELLGGVLEAFAD